MAYQIINRKKVGWDFLFFLRLVISGGAIFSFKIEASNQEPKENWDIGIMASPKKPNKKHHNAPSSPNHYPHQRPLQSKHTIPEPTKPAAAGPKSEEQKTNWVVEAIVNLPGNNFCVWINGKLLKSGYCTTNDLVITGVHANRVEGYWHNNPQMTFAAYVGESLPPQPLITPKPPSP